MGKKYKHLHHRKGLSAIYKWTEGGMEGTKEVFILFFLAKPFTSTGLENVAPGKKTKNKKQRIGDNSFFSPANQLRLQLKHHKHQGFIFLKSVLKEE